MKSIAKTLGRIIMAASIPLMILASCESDLVEPNHDYAPKKSKMTLPPR